MRTLQTEGNAEASRYADEIVELGPWFHNLHLPDGTQTAPGHPLGDFPRFKWEQVAASLPTSLTGKTVLDIGCNAGFYSFALAARGATVLGIDVNQHYLEQARWAAQIFEFGPRVQFEQCGVYELAAMRERFDVVLFMGVFYHLRYPLLALDAVVERCRDTLVFQSLSFPGGDGGPVPENLSLAERDRMLADTWPKMAYIPHELEGDETNWWAPNAACVEHLLERSGFDIAARPGHEIYIGRRNGRDRPPGWADEFQAAIGCGVRENGGAKC